jgi:hypothetical protein
MGETVADSGLTNVAFSKLELDQRSKLRTIVFTSGASNGDKPLVSKMAPF